MEEPLPSTSVSSRVGCGPRSRLLGVLGNGKPVTARTPEPNVSQLTAPTRRSASLCLHRNAPLPSWSVASAPASAHLLSRCNSSIPLSVAASARSVAASASFHVIAPSSRIEVCRPQIHYRQRKGTRTHHRCVPRPPRYTICRFGQRTSPERAATARLRRKRTLAEPRGYPPESIRNSDCPTLFGITRGSMRNAFTG